MPSPNDETGASEQRDASREGVMHSANCTHLIDALICAVQWRAGEAQAGFWESSFAEAAGVLGAGGDSSSD